MRHDDTLKKKRLNVGYKHAYLSGSQLFLLESGNECVHGYGCHYDRDHDVCRSYRAVLEEMKEIFEQDERPVGGPKVKVAFVSGLHEAEHSWMLLNDLQTKRPWDDVANYGEYDTSAAPAYGQYDIVPIETDVEALARYEFFTDSGRSTAGKSI